MCSNGPANSTFFFHWQKLDLANVPVDPEASLFDLLVKMCLEQEGAFLSALCSSVGGGSVGHCDQQLEERPFPGEKKTEWLEEFSPTFQMFLVGGRKVIVVEIDNRLLIGHRDFLVTKVFTKMWALCEGGHGSSDKCVYL